MSETMKQNVLMCLGIAVVSLILWPVLDLACAHFITHTVFHYSIYLHVVMPLIFSALCCLLGVFAPQQTLNA